MQNRNYSKPTFLLFWIITLAIAEFAFSMDLNTSDEKIYIIKSMPDAKSPTGVYIPKDINEAMKILDQILSPKFREEIKQKAESELDDYHFGLSAWFRNNWAGINEGSRLYKYFESFGTVFSTDDFSSMILISYWRYLNDKPLKLKEQLDFYDEYWKQYFFKSKRMK